MQLWPPAIQRRRAQAQAGLAWPLGEYSAAACLRLAADAVVALLIACARSDIRASATAACSRCQRLPRASQPTTQPEICARALKAAEPRDCRRARPLPLDEARLWREIGGWLASYMPRPPRRPHTTLRGCGAGSAAKRRGARRVQCGGWLRRAASATLGYNAADGQAVSRCAGVRRAYGYCLCGSRGAPRAAAAAVRAGGIEAHVRRGSSTGATRRATLDGNLGGGRGAPGGAAPTRRRSPAKCACRYDGLDGYLCQHRTAQFCLNQCSGRGRAARTTACDRAGGASIALSRRCRRPRRRRGSRRAAAARVRVRDARRVHDGAAATAPRQALRRALPQGQPHPVRVRHLPGVRPRGAFAEWLSRRRTARPGQADWFYVPVYASCAIVTAIFETNSTRTRHRLALASQLYARALAHVRSAHPYWDASGGANPRVDLWVRRRRVLRAARAVAVDAHLALGNTMATHNRCTTTYDFDRWDVARDPTSRLPLALAAGDHPCYDPRRTS